MFVAILGRLPKLSIAELEAMFGKSHVRAVSRSTAVVDTDNLSIDSLGGSLKCGKIIHTLPADGHPTLEQTSHWITRTYVHQLLAVGGKITLGISAYGFSISPRQLQSIGLLLKTSMKKHNVSLRLIPNTTTELSTATSHNNKLGLSPKKRELFIIKTDDNAILIAESNGAQNITAYARRDRNRPRRDAFVGMLPPKLAQIMVNLAVGNAAKATILDPFCGTGTVLQEALLKGYDVCGSDLSQKMIDYTTENLTWLQSKYHITGTVHSLEQADAMTHQWPKAQQLNAVVCETYLGQPFSAPPSPKKLHEVTGNCNHIITNFLRNIHSQLTPGTTLCIAVPAWRDASHNLTHLPLIKDLKKLGYILQQPPLIYSRSDQVVVREILLLKTA
jgi:predicted DNA methylase